LYDSVCFQRTLLIEIYTSLFLAHRHNKKAQHWRTDTMASTSTARPEPTKDLLHPGCVPLSKDVIVSALAKPSFWGKADK
jgi:hypothetical protein